MKIQIIGCLLSLAVADTASGQLGYGLEVGAGMSTMRFAPDMGFTQASKKPVASWKAGIVIDAGINKKVYFQSGICFTSKGQKRDYSFYVADTLNEKVAQSLRLSYIEVPVMLCYKSAVQGRGRVVAGIGAAAAYQVGGRHRLSAEGVYNGTAFNTTIDEKAIANRPLSPFDIGLSLVAGYELPTGWMIRAYYTAGVNDLGQGTEIDKNRMFGIAVGYMAGKGRNIYKERDELIEK
ncbi:MAG: PorT family protein [Taibaiella sp.]|nr:PorT family protein [Taibaiella sp.]